MNGTSHNAKICSFEKSYPGCLGRMVNLFELNLGVSANKLLTDKPHQDCSPISKSNSDVSRVSPSISPIEEKVIASDLKSISSSRKTNGTPMKMLIAQEMSKEVDSRRSPPNLVAKLMGLDSLPQQEPESTMQRNRFKGHPRSHSEIPMSNWEQQKGFFHYVEANEYKDVYEVWEHSPKSACKGRHIESADDKNMAFVRQKFAEAKRMSMDEKLRQSKQFQDALEVLNSNKDLFLKCMQEPNTLLSQQLHILPSLSHNLEAKRITVLKPSKVAEGNDLHGAGNKGGTQKKMGTFDQPHDFQKNKLETSPLGNWMKYDSPTQPTRIVVLKPGLSKTQNNDKAMGSPHSQSARIQSEDFFGDVEDNVNKESIEVTKTITEQMQERLGRHHRDEIMVPSVFSNGYVADESSFNKSEIGSQAGNLSDSEVMSPVSRQSWDYVNRLGSPYSSSSFSRASYSPESSVCREAKKRLSERWAMMASSLTSQEQKHVRKSSSTLGEMLALSDSKKTAMPGEEGNLNDGSSSTISLFGGEQRTNEDVDNSPSSLMRSKSVPVSSTQFGTRISSEAYVAENSKIVPKESIKGRSNKSSFKGKVSSLFFSRSKKPTKGKSQNSESKDDLCSPNGLTNKVPNPSSPDLIEPSGETSLLDLIFKQSMLPSQTEVPLEKPFTLGNPGENQEQPSPISVLDPPFEDNEHMAKLFLPHEKPGRQDFELPLNSISSKLIDKSPPIGSIARTVSRDDSCVNTSSSYSKREILTSSGTQGEEVQEWILFAKTLLSVTGLQDELQSESFSIRFHSQESPLDPSLRDKYINVTDKETLHEARRRKKRSLQKLVFDCVNAALVDTASLCQRSSPCIESNNIFENPSSTILDELWARLNTWFSGEMRCVLDGCGGENSLLVERMVQKEVVGTDWINKSRQEMDNFGNEIEGKLLEELVQETLVELTGTS